MVRPPVSSLPADRECGTCGTRYGSGPVPSLSFGACSPSLRRSRERRLALASHEASAAGSMPVPPLNKPPKRTESVNVKLAAMFDERSKKASSANQPLDARTQTLLNELLGPLLSEPPQASQAAEAALTLATFSIVEGRVLNLVDPAAGDLTEKNRIKGDRTTGDKLCREILAARNIPATKGPFQSSSYRSGYKALQAQNRALSDYASWQSESGRTLDDIQQVVDELVDAVLACSASLPPLPSLLGDRFTFVAYRQARDRLLSAPSRGALEQYLLAGLLDQELRASSGAQLRAETKNVGANDASSKAAGDIEVRQHHALRGAIEVTTASWEDKLDQLENVVQAHLSDATIAASNVIAKTTGEDLAKKVSPTAERLGLDVAVVDLHGLMDVAASRITRASRAAAFAFVYRCIVMYHRREPELAERLIRVLTELHLVSDDQIVAAEQDDELGLIELVDRVKEVLESQRLIDHPEVPSALREIAEQIETRPTQV